MIKIVFIALVSSSLSFSSSGDLESFDKYLKNFDLKERSNMKINTIEMLHLLEEGRAILVDIRFKKEFEAWNMPSSINIPLNELPKRFDELPKDKLIVTACPHNDRSNMARIYLTLKGYNVKYLSDGLLKVADFLRGDYAVEFIDEYTKNKK